jgi:predicted AlkP superfamily pyrophosphatase or phosphodiesterase
LQGTATDNLMDRYFHKHGRYIKGPDRSLDLFTMALALDILEDYDQPDIMLVKMCDLDSARHTYGVHHPKVTDQLRKHDEEFGALLEVLKRKGQLSQTNFVVLGDHGMTDVRDVLLLNVLLRDAGFIKTDEEGNLTSFEALSHSNGLSAYVELRDPSDATMKRKVRDFLQSLVADSRVMLDYVMDMDEARQVFGVDGPFDFIIESKLPISFGERLDGDAIWESKIPGDHKIGVATHGGSPTRAEVTTFIASGPDIQEGVVMERRPMVDEAPTIARMLGFEMPCVDGLAIEEFLR